jgi:hypothetical protein
MLKIKLDQQREIASLDMDNIIAPGEYCKEV